METSLWKWRLTGLTSEACGGTRRIQCPLGQENKTLKKALRRWKK
jgi:hypothetical protein